MVNAFTDRFEPTKILAQNRTKLTAIGTDHLLGLPEVLIKIVRKGYFDLDRGRLAELFAWHRGIRHPNLGEILDAGLTPMQDLYSVRPYYQAFTVYSNQVIFATQLVAAVKTIHSANHLHGAIRPANILHSDGSLKLVDPRILLRKSPTLTEEDIRFTAPEIMAGANASTASDLYSIGTVLYRLFCNRDPFDDFDLTNLKSKYMWASPRPLLGLNDILTPIVELVELLLDKDPLSRPTLTDLEHAFSSQVGVIDAPTVGRDRETQLIESFFDKRPPAGLKVVIIEGAPGIGKTRLVTELVAASRFQGVASALANCNQGTRTPFRPLLHAIQHLFREYSLFRKGKALGAMRHLWPSLTQDSPEQNLSDNRLASPSARVASEIASSLQAFSERTPTTVVLDDVDRADADTVYALEQLCWRAPEIPVNLILTFRSNLTPFALVDLFQKQLTDNLLHITLGPLCQDAAKQIGAYFGTSERKNGSVNDLCGGNPLFIQEAARVATPNRLSERLDEIFQSSIATLTKTSLELAYAISILGKTPDINIIQSLSAMSRTELETQAHQLQCVGLVFIDGGSVSFTYEGFRMRIYSSIPRGKRTRLHRAAYSLLRHKSAFDEILAEHAFRGRLYEQAIPLFIRLGNDFKAKAKYPAAVEYYKKAAECQRLMARPLDLTLKFELAICYTLIGKYALAAKIYQYLLSNRTDHPDSRQLHASVYHRLSIPEFKETLSEQVRLCCLGIDTAPAGWTGLARLYAVLSQLLVQSGELINAQKALDYATEHLVTNVETDLQGLIDLAQGLLWLNAGRFREAAARLQSPRIDTPIRLAGAHNNAALCSEHLGDLTRARELQLAAQRFAEASGHALAQVLSLINLGAFETKLGHFTEGERFFVEAKNRLRYFQKRDKSFRPSVAAVLWIDLARLELELGRYRDANEHLKSAAKGSPRGWDIGDLILTKCELNITLSNTSVIPRLLTSFPRSEIFITEFFRAECSLMESWSEGMKADESSSRLVVALGVSLRLGTDYQRCKILNRLSQILLFTDKASAHRHATESIELAQRRGYKPLAARAHLTLALACDDAAQKESALMTAFHAAIQIGMPELAAESAFHIAAERHRTGHYVIAEQYLLTSVAKTTELFQNVPDNLRLKYSAVTWRREGPKLHQDCRHRIQRSFLRSEAIGYAHDKYFRALYRLTLVAKHKLLLEDLFSSLLEVVHTTIQRPVVLMIGNEETYTYESVKMKVDEDLKMRLRSLSEKADNAPYFGGGQKKGVSADVLAWIPLLTRTYSGGLFVASRSCDEPLNEQEIEFLTIAACIANESVSRFETASINRTKTVEVSQFHNIIGGSKTIKNVYSQIQIAAGNSATVLIEGESGTGKELVAKAIHEAGPRAKEAFIPVDCGAIPEALIEAELFGAKRGAYTGAVADRRGLFEAAHKGTIFLDEISNMATALQAKLLRVIQEREVRRIGETKGRAVDVRLIVASNQSLEMLVSEGRFRKDLLYRLKVLHINVPPLRNRRDDIPMLAQAFMQKLNAANKAKKYFGVGVVNRVLTHPFPGNVRELQNAIERAFFSAKGNVIGDIPLERTGEAGVSGDEVQNWFKDLSEGRKDFWSAIHNRYKRRDISREKVLALVDLGLRSTRGNYKTMALKFHVKERDYRRFMDFLRRNECLLDFRPYRKSAAESRAD